MIETSFEVVTILFKSITRLAKLDYDPNESLASFRLTQSKRKVQIRLFQSCIPPLFFIPFRHSAAVKIFVPMLPG